MASAGQRYVETVDAIANAPYTDYQLGQVIIDLDTANDGASLAMYVRGAAAWLAVTLT